MHPLGLGAAVLRGLNPGSGGQMHPLGPGAAVLAAPENHEFD